MSETELGSAHLSDEEIEAYSRRVLAEAEEERVERHYLGCAACHERVRFSEDLVAALAAMRPEGRARRHGRALQAAAAVLVVAGLVAAWQLGQRTVPTPTPQEPAAASVRPEAVARLAPPTRDGDIAVVEVAVGPNLRLVIDAREGGAPGTRFEVTIAPAGGEPIYHASDIASSSTGELEVEVAGERLGPGRYLVEARTEGATVAIPFRVRE